MEAVGREAYPAFSNDPGRVLLLSDLHRLRSEARGKVTMRRER